MFSCCGVPDDKIHFGVPVSKEQNLLSLQLIKMQCCVCVCGGGGGGSGEVGSVTETRRVCLRLPLPGSYSEPEVSSDSSHHPVQLVCAQIVLNIYYYNETSLCKNISSGGMLPDPPGRALAGGERRFWAGNKNRPLFN